MRFLAPVVCTLVFSLNAFSQQYVKLSQDLLQAMKDDELDRAAKLVNQVEAIDPQALARELDTQEEILAFWINIYNGLAQYKLSRKPRLFRSHNSFFSEEIFVVARKRMSLDDIEHGILRRGTSKYSRGYFKNLFRDDWFEKYQAKTIDWRIHFAINCGAASCPPIRIYDPDDVYRELNQNSREYLSRNVRYDKERQVVYVPRIMSWYSGDFGGADGVRDILRRNGYIPAGLDVEIVYSDYDWTMDLGHFHKE